MVSAISEELRCDGKSVVGNALISVTTLKPASITKLQLCRGQSGTLNNPAEVGTCCALVIPCTPRKMQWQSGNFLKIFPLKMILPLHLAKT